MVRRLGAAGQPRLQHCPDATQLGVRPAIPGRDRHPLQPLVRPHPPRIVVHQHHLGRGRAGDEGQVLVLPAPADELQPPEQPRRQVAGPVQVGEHLPRVGLLDGGEHRDPPEPRVAEGQEVGQTRAGAATQGVVDQGALEVEREHFDAHPSGRLPSPNDCVHLRAGCKERGGAKNRNAGPSSATSWFGGAAPLLDTTKLFSQAIVSALECQLIRAGDRDDPPKRAVRPRIRDPLELVRILVFAR